MLSENLALFIQTYRNSIGDLAVPIYSRWQEDMMQTEDMGLYYKGASMIMFIWIVWITHQFIILILLLNFLIAIVSQSYENVMQQSEIFLYNQRLELNSETIVIVDFFGRLPEFRTLIIASLDDEARADEAADEWKGLVTNMKDYFSKVMKGQKKHIEEQVAIIQKDNQLLKKEVSAIKDKMNVCHQQNEQIIALLQNK